MYGYLSSIKSMLVIVKRLFTHRFFTPGGIHTLFCRTNMHKVFVYGTLKRNEPNHHWLTNPSNGEMTFIGEGVTKEKYPLVIASKYNIPFLLYCPGNGHNVEGEVYEVDDNMLCQLDVLEEHPEFYVRELDDIYVNFDCKTETMQCWVYFLKDFKPLILTLHHLVNYSSNGPHGRRYKDSNSGSPVSDDDDLDPHDVKKGS